MKKGLFAIAAAAAMSLGVSAFAAPVVTFNLSVTQPDGTPITLNADGSYHLNAGQQFVVNFGSSIASPNTLGASRNATVKGKSLGLQGMSTNIVSSGNTTGLGDSATAGIVSPVIDVPAAGPVPANQQNGTSFQDMTGFAPASINLGDLGSDGDLDVTGSGFVNISLTAPTNNTTYANFSLGLDGSPVFSHLYTASSTKGGYVYLHTNTSTANVYSDPGSGSLQSVSALNGLTEGSVKLFVSVPEPASLSFLGLGVLGLAARRRQA